MFWSSNLSTPANWVEGIDTVSSILWVPFSRYTSESNLIFPASIDVAWYVLPPIVRAALLTAPVKSLLPAAFSNSTPPSNLVDWLSLIVPLAIVTSEYPQSALTTDGKFASLVRVIVPPLIVVFLRSTLFNVLIATLYPTEFCPSSSAITSSALLITNVYPSPSAFSMFVGVATTLYTADFPESNWSLIVRVTSLPLTR